MEISGTMHWTFSNILEVGRVYHDKGLLSDDEYALWLEWNATARTPSPRTGPAISSISLHQPGSEQARAPKDPNNAPLIRHARVRR